jgi:hypothetical protein
MNSTDDLTNRILQRFQTLIEEDLTEEEIEARIKTDFSEEEQKLLTETILGAIVSSEGERHLGEEL